MDFNKRISLLNAMAVRITARQPYVSRKARAHFLARRSIDQFVLRLEAVETRYWQPHLFGAWRILARELGLTNAQARHIAVKSAVIANKFLKVQSKGVEANEASKAPLRIRETCIRLAKCFKRAPAALRRKIDDAVTALVKRFENDLETVEDIFRETATILSEEQFERAESARTALKALRAPRAADYGTLPSSARQSVSSLFAKLAASSKPIKAANLFADMAKALSAPV